MPHSSDSPISARGCVLIVEDNRFHQVVAADMLRRNGFSCDIVGNGQLAVAAVTQKNYAAILMDCEMPVMDGFQATLAIRQMERQHEIPIHRGGRIPILANTACTDAGIEERCLSAGMDVYFRKPANEALLITALSSVVGVAEPTALISTAPVSPRIPLNLATLLERCMGDQGLMITMIGHFQTQAIDDWRNIQAAFDTFNLDGVRSAAHSLKGASAYLAAEPLRSAAEKLEQMARSGAIDAARLARDVLDVELSSTLVDLQSALMVGRK